MAGPWEKYASTTPVQDAPQGPWSKYQAPEASQPAQVAPAAPGREQGFTAAFEQAVKSTPETFGKGVEAIGSVTELEPVEHVGRWLMEKTKPAETGYVPLQWKDLHEAGDVWTWLKEQAGAGVGSMVVPGASALVGAAVGSPAGPAGAAVGALGGAALSGVPINIGDAVQQFEDEGIDRK